MGRRAVSSPPFRQKTFHGDVVDHLAVGRGLRRVLAVLADEGFEEVHSELPVGQTAGVVTMSVVRGRGAVDVIVEPE